MKKIIVSLLVAVSVLGFSGTVFARDMVQIKGSDTLINLVQRLAEVYLQKHPGFFIAITGGGSGTGIAALVNGKCDIANASRTMKTQEMKQAEANGITVKRIIIAMDGLSVITSAKNQVNKLTTDQIGKIFRGEVTNWKDVGGKDMNITLYGRQSNSGTFVFFRDAVIKADYSMKMNRMNGNAQIVEAVRQDESGIGYVGVGYVKAASGLNVVKVASPNSGNYASPLNSDDVKSGKYPLSRPLNQYLNGLPKGKVRNFLEFELSEDGQKIIEEEGFFPITDEYRELNRKNLGQ